MQQYCRIFANVPVISNSERAGIFGEWLRAGSRGYTHLSWIMRYIQRCSASLHYCCVNVPPCDICGKPRRSDDAEFYYTWSGISPPWDALSYATTPLTPPDPSDPLKPPNVPSQNCTYRTKKPGRKNRGVGGVAPLLAGGG